MRLLLVLATSFALVPAVPAAPAPAPATSVVAIVGDAAIDVLHPDFALRPGERLALPPAARRAAVTVTLPGGRDRDARLDALRRGPLGNPRPRTLYYVAGTRILLWVGSESVDLLAGDDHGTGTASAAVGRAGGAPSSVLLFAAASTHEGWQYVAAQPWVDVASDSVFEVVGGEAPGLCDSAPGIVAFRRSGRLGFAAAGNGPVDTTVFPTGGHPALLRVGGVRPDGTTALPRPESTTSYSARAYDLAETYETRIAVNGTDDYRTAGGTSGSSPHVAGRVAEVLRQVRAAVGDGGTGARDGALVVARKRPARGPLSDGRLTADELERVVLAASRPSLGTAQGRYAVEGYGWFDTTAQQRARDAVLGRAVLPERPEDDAAREAAGTARTAAMAARACPT